MVLECVPNVSEGRGTTRPFELCGAPWANPDRVAARLTAWELAGVVVPLFVILAVQVALVAAICVWAIPRLMGMDYDAVVIAGGFCGFMLGTTANAMANMGALVERYGPAPKAYLVVPLVGAFGIDFVNGLLITATINFWR